MKILFLTNIPAPYRVEFFSLLGKHCDLTVIYELANATDRDKNWKNNTAFKTYKEIYLNAKRMKNDGGFSFKILKYLNKTYDFIIVGTHGTLCAKLAMLYMRLCNIPYILNLDGGLVNSLKDKSKLNLFLRKLMFKGAKYYLTTNDESIKYLNYFGIKKEKIFKYRFSSIVKKDIGNEDINDVEKNLLKKKLNMKENRIIISVGRLSVDGDIFAKGFDVLLKVSKKIRENVGIYIIGSEITEAYKKLIKQYDLKNIYFISFKNKVELIKYYKVADIFALLTKSDTWGLVINEALSKGLPIITTKNCGAGLELIKDYENGFLVDVGDVEDTANKINFILENKDLRYKMMKNNIELATKYTIETMVEDHLKIFRKLLEV